MGSRMELYPISCPFDLEHLSDTRYLIVGTLVREVGQEFR